jgi:membrane protease YdiL (CAAX protease family)
MSRFPPLGPVRTAPPHEPEPPPRDPDVPPWPIWTAPAAVALGLTVALFVSAFAGAFGRASATNPTPAVALISSVLVDAGFVGAALYLAALHGRARPSDFGYRKVAPGLAISAFFTAGVGYYVVTLVYGQLIHLRGNEKLPKELGVSNSTAALVGATIFVCVIAPMAEEFFFRGFIFGALRRWRIEIAGRNIGTWVAAVLTGILFGLAHTGSASSQYLVPLGFFGFVLCLLRWRTRSLYPCMALHSVNNSLALGIGQEHWSAAPILGLTLAALVVIGAATLPLSGREPAPA